MKKIALFALLFGSLAISSLATPSRYGMIGLTPGETLRINVANPEVENPTTLPPGPCHVKLAFLDSSGNELLPAVQLTLPSGQSAHYDLNGDRLFPPGVNLPAVQRVEVRPVVLILSDPPPASTDPAIPPGPCVSSIEIFDRATGKTLVTSGPQNPGVIAGFNPQPDPPKIFGPLGLVAGQTLRLNAANVLDRDTTAFPPDPCRVTLVFFGSGGFVLGSTTQVLSPGAATFLDFSLPSSVGAAERVEIRADVTVESLGTHASPPDPCRATLELFDNATGRTLAIQSPQHVRSLLNLPEAN